MDRRALRLPNRREAPPLSKHNCEGSHSPDSTPVPAQRPCSFPGSPLLCAPLALLVTHLQPVCARTGLLSRERPGSLTQCNFLLPPVPGGLLPPSASCINRAHTWGGRIICVVSALCCALCMCCLTECSLRPFRAGIINHPRFQMRDLRLREMKPIAPGQELVTGRSGNQVGGSDRWVPGPLSKLHSHSAACLPARLSRCAVRPWPLSNEI